LLASHSVAVAGRLRIGCSDEYLLLGLVVLTISMPPACAPIIRKKAATLRTV
jgi:hypothetical protein